MLNKRQRLKVYRQMLSDYKQGHPETSRGFCRYLQRLWYALPGTGFIYLYDLEELVAQQPKTFYREVIGGKRYSTAYWWKPGNRKLRVRAIKRAVAMAKRKVKRS